MSPINARSQLEQLILSTEKTIMIYVQTLDDEHMLTLIASLIATGKKVEICTADNESNQARQREFTSWQWKLIRKPYLHAKVIIIDHSQVFIGSHNLTTNAIENNREMGIILTSRDDIVRQIESDFFHDGCR